MDDAHPQPLTLSAHSAFAPFRPTPVAAAASVPIATSSVPPSVSATRDLVHLYRACNPRFAFDHLVPRRCLTKPSKPAHNNDWDNRDHDYILYVNDTLSDDHGNTYTVLDLLGTGTFGQVVKCRHNRTADVVAVKIIKNQPAYFNQAWVEINILRMLHLNNHPDNTRHIVKLYSHFVFRGHLCLVFERLSINLYELLKQNNHVGLGLDMLRSFLSQILQALNVLVASEVIHCDLKPENILIKTLDTAEVKIIDFGSACQLHYPVYSYVQSRFYRSPEVLLGWPKYDSKIDMWSLGCVTAELFLGIPLFPGQNEMNMVCRIVEMLGEMPHRFLQHCRHTHKFFNSPRMGNTSNDMNVYTLKPVAQYEQETNQTLPEWKRFFKEKKLRDIIMTYPRRTPPPHTEELRLRESLVDLMHGMLKSDPRERWTPAEALQHPFMNGEPLANGQPWTPPSRSRRVIRSRPVCIDAANHADESIMNDNIYTASAPNFNTKGHLAVPSVAASRFAPPPFTTMPQQHVSSMQPPTNPQAHSIAQSPCYPFGEEQPLPTANAIAPGSYVPPPAPSMFAQPNFQPVGGPMHTRANPGSYIPTGRSDRRNPLYQPQYPQRELVRSYNQHPQIAQMSAVQTAIGSPGGAMPSTPPLSYAAAMRLGAGLHLSASRESLSGSGSLHPSASRESLALAREASQNDLSEDPMFAFGSDDEGFSPTGAQMVGSTASQPVPGLAGGQLPPNPSSLQGASSALPPPGPRPPIARASMHGPSSAYSPYGYSSSNFLPGRAHRPTSSSLLPLQPTLHPHMETMPSADVDMSDLHRINELPNVEPKPPAIQAQFRSEAPAFQLGQEKPEVKTEDIAPVPLGTVDEKPKTNEKAGSSGPSLS